MIALAGSPRAGKTSCMTAIASALLHDDYAKYNLSMQRLDNDEDWDLLEEEILWYRRGYNVIKTPQKQDRVPSYSMLITCNKEERVLTFVDMPGEYWQNGRGLEKEFFQQYSALYKLVDCIWMFIDKLTAFRVDLDALPEESAKKLMTIAGVERRLSRIVTLVVLVQCWMR